MIREDILSRLAACPGDLLTGGQLARELGVSRTAVWKAIGALREEGHAIESMPNRGYRLLPSSDGLSRAAIQAALGTQSFGRSMELHEALPSTNLYLRGLPVEQLPEGHTVIADGQTAGRGRLGRPFCSPAREGVYLSILLKPRLPLPRLTLLTLCAAEAVCRALEAVCAIRPGVKWVNDVYYGGKKLCGILTEAMLSAELQRVEHAVVGIGINTGAVDASVEDIATSTQAITGARGIRNRLIASVLTHFEALYRLLCAGDADAVLIPYRARLCIAGKRVWIDAGGRRCRATVCGVDASGALVVRDEGGEERALTSGEIHPYGEEPARFSEGGIP